jgi:hypothetical protein
MEGGFVMKFAPGIVAGIAVALVVPLSAARADTETARRAAVVSAAVSANVLTCNAAPKEDIGACVSRMLADDRSPYSPGHEFTREEKQAVTAPRQIAAASPAQIGSWSVLASCGLADDQVNPIHASLTKTGKVLLTAGSGWNTTNFAGKVFETWLWDPANPSACAKEIPMPDKDLFCSGHLHLADGRILFFGGTSRYGEAATPEGDEDNFAGLRESYVFDDVSETFVATGLMNVAGWYPNAAANAAGSPVKVGGLDDTSQLSSTNEIYSSASGQWVKLTGQRTFPMYADLRLRKNGTLCYVGVYYAGRVGVAPQCWNWSTNQSTGIPGLYFPDCRDQASSLMLDPAHAQKVMVIGGGCSSGTTGTTSIVDLNAAAPRFVGGPHLGFAAMHTCAVVLPDGSAFVAGGGNHNTRPQLRASRLPYPYTGAWQQLASPAVPRLYRSTCLLLPDGSVLTMGTTSGAVGGVETRFEIYKPPYMQPGVVRPAITSVTPTLRLGGTYIAGYTGPAAITGASLTKLGSATHSVDSNQRKVFVGVAPAGAGRVSLRIEANWGILPLGAYMLTLTDSRRIPSKSVMVQVVRATPTAAASGIDQSAACCCC